MKFILFIVFNLSYNLHYSQVANFPRSPKKSIEGDTVAYELIDKKGYDYFTNQFYHDLVFSIDSTDYYMLEKVNINTGKGYFRIYNDNKLIYHYDITQNKIEGIGVCFENRKVSYFSGFKNGEKNGLGTTFSNDGMIERVFYFKNNKFKKYIYHNLSNSDKQLRKVNKNAKGPFLPIIR